MLCARHVSEITIIRYDQNRKLGKPNNSNSFGSKQNKQPK